MFFLFTSARADGIVAHVDSLVGVDVVQEWRLKRKIVRDAAKGDIGAAGENGFGSLAGG